MACIGACDLENMVIDFYQFFFSFTKLVNCQHQKTFRVYTANPLYNDIRYNGKIRYNVNSVCTEISGSFFFSLTVPCYSLGKHTFSMDIC